VLTALLDKHAPVRTSRRRPPKKISRWLSDEVIGAKRLRRRLERRWRFSGSEADRINYRRACRDANRLINVSRKDHFRSRIEATGGDFIHATQRNLELTMRTAICLNHLQSISLVK